MGFLGRVLALVVAVAFVLPAASPASADVPTPPGKGPIGWDALYGASGAGVFAWTGNGSDWTRIGDPAAAITAGP